MKTDAPLKIVALQSENVKRLRAVHIRPDGSLIVIKGENGAGKSSVLDSIAYALGGEKLCPPRVIRRGEAAAEVTLDLGHLIVTRRWTAGGSTLAVKSPEGAKYPSPQAILDKLVGRLSFDPLAFTGQKPDDQVETLRKLVGLDFTAHDREHAELYEERTVVNRDANTIRGSLARMPEVDAPDQPISVKALLEEQQKLLATKEANDKLRAAARDAAVERAKTVEWHERTKRDVAQLEAELANARKEESTAAAALARAQENEQKARLAAQAQDPDLGSIRKQLADAEGINARVRQKRERAATAEKLAAKEAESKSLTQKIDALDAKKQADLAAAKFPVEGLSFSDEGVTFDGLPFEQASKAEQIRVSFAVSLALNPKLKVVLIRDANALGEKSLALVAQLAADAGAQVWCEFATFRPGDGPPGILIEDGAVDGVLPERASLEVAQ